tara:strand:+ start:691 stop:831 length:141 start_codon:yes stop_codon:yes gene_type:complete
MKKFEYKSVYSIPIEEANKLGKEGWELVTFQAIMGDSQFAWFKREI